MQLFLHHGSGYCQNNKKRISFSLSSRFSNKNKLGTISWAKTKHGVIVVNGYTQYHWKGKGIQANYKAIEQVFSQIKTQFSGLKIAYPAIGAGLAKGDWPTIAKIIEEKLNKEDHTFVQYKP